MKCHPFHIALALMMPLASSVVAQDAAQTEIAGDKANGAAKFIRIQRDANDQPMALQTAVIRFQKEVPGETPITVDLVSAVHVADAKYYSKLNQLFTEYDAVLFELVAPEGTKIPKGGRRSRGFNPVSSMQNLMKNVLDLRFQLNAIDYTQANLVHADMTPAEFAQSMRDRNESFIKIFFRMMGQAMAAQNTATSTSDVDFLMALFARNRSLQLKRVLAEQFEEMDGFVFGLDGPQGSTIITERNKKALSVLKKTIADGKKKLAIFYGAGHMSDIEKRLTSEFGMRRTDRVLWLDAWKLTSD